jgi:protease IV
MIKWRMFRWLTAGASARLALALAAASCMGKPSDDARSVKPVSDPWASSRSGSEAPSQRGSDSSSPHKNPAPDSPMGLLSGLGMLSRIGDSLRDPGPYEAPRTSARFDADQPHWLVLTLSGAVVERAAVSWTGKSGTELRALQQRIEAVATTPNRLGLLLRFADLDLSFPDALELRDSIKKVRAAGKRVVCHSHGTLNVEYLVMAACDRVAIAPLGQIAITGPSATPVHLRPLLMRFGVTADFLHVGAYKGAAEPFTRDAPSPEMTEVLGQILDQHYQTMVETIAADRGLPADQVKARIDIGVFTPEQAVSAKLSDAVVSFEALREAEVKAPWIEAAIEAEEDHPLQAMTTLMQFLGTQPVHRPSHPHIAVVYAVGNIVDGSGQGLLGARQEIAAATLVPALRVLAADDSVKAVLLRVDSGGGSAQASELIWQAMTALRAKKPVVVSMSDFAASGGYYIACNAAKIFAQADTLTGSIGVVGGRLAFGPALAQQGVRSFPMGRGKRATMTASLGAWTPDQRQAIQQLMEAVYQTFVGRVVAGRGKPLDQVLAIAQGHVWTGAKAKELGLIDELGGFEAAYAEAARLGGVDVAAEPEIYPPAPTLRDLAVSFGQLSPSWLGATAINEMSPTSATSATSAMGELHAIAALDPQLAAIARELLAQLGGFRSSGIQTVAWLPRIR